MGDRVHDQSSAAAVGGGPLVGALVVPSRGWRGCSSSCFIRALLGFFAALHRAELAALTVDQISSHDRGLVLALPRSKTNPRGEQAELVVLPRTGRRSHCPVTALHTWLEHAGITDGPVLRKISRGSRALPHPLHPESVNDLVQAAAARAGIQGGPYSAHSLRAGFVTDTHLRGASDRAIAHSARSAR